VFGQGRADHGVNGVGPEFARIRDFVRAARAPGAAASVPVPVGDDAAALVTPAGEVLVVSTDLCIEGVHFERAWLPWASVGFRATAAALSDLAAMAATPLGVLVSLALPPELDAGVATVIGDGVGECLRLHGAALLGGDLASSPGPVMLDVVVLGSCRTPMRRSGARPGDELWVTGRLGGAARAVSEWGSGREPEPEVRRSFERPTARLREASWLAARAALHALIDLSDGLASDAGHMAAASGALLEIECGRIPLCPTLAGAGDRKFARALALSGGEDYELLLAAAPGEIDRLRKELEREFAAEITRIGRVCPGSGVRWVDANGSEVPPPPPGFDHFAPGRES